ncbi:MAG: zf-HC2 domain-containing protein [Actinomycetia bacterium]|nr:zf-HC2 domain-containing protein [Actinomycetes bacterium]
MTWHVPEQLVSAYAVGELAGARAASIEAHVMTCAECRLTVNAEVPTERMHSIWAAVEDEVDAPRRSWAERVLSALGMADSDARLVSGAPSLHASWLLSLAAVLAFAVWASNSRSGGTTLFLILAPIVPVLAVGGSYGRGIDPTFEVSVASPYPTMRLVLLRSTAVVAASGVLALVASLFVPSGGYAAAWLLPCLALLSITLVVARWLPLPVAAAGVAACYALPLIAALVDNRDVAGVLLSASVQWTALALAVSASLFLAHDPMLRSALRRNR